MIFTRPQNWVASDLNISNGQQDNHVGLLLEVRSTFMLTKNILNKMFGQLNKLFSVKEFLYPTQRFIRISGDFIKIR